MLFTLETPLSVVGTISPGFAVPEASTTSLVLPEDGGLNSVLPAGHNIQYAWNA